MPTTRHPHQPRTRPLTETAYALIKRSIIRCELEPGGPVSEEQLASLYGVGRAAVRAALKRLYQEQFVEHVSRQRYVVAPITLKHVQELFDVRLLLEPAAARRAANHVDGEHLRRLNKLCQARYRVGDRTSAEAFLRANTEFHTIVARSSGNRALADMIVGLLEKVERIHHMGHLLRDRNEEASHEHHDLIEALVAGDCERAERIMTEQITAARTFVLESMLSSPSVQLVNVAAGRDESLAGTKA
ncbi:MAG TPA: GntR family transcriptional regulator [bacterium]|nr:GntR family transcriptional regulator [bacterium]